MFILFAQFINILIHIQSFNFCTVVFIHYSDEYILKEANYRFHVYFL
jgi:hypothetical protein